MLNPRSFFWRTVRRYQRRLSFLGAALGAVGFHEYVRADQPDLGWIETTAWSVGVFLAIRWGLKKTLELTVNYVTSGLKEITGDKGK